MTDPGALPEDFRAAVHAALRVVAPEVDAAALDPRAPLREQADLDSIDVLRFLAELERRLGLELPEAEVTRVTDLEGLARLAVEQRGRRAGAGP